jgi:predicted nucleic acid-binding protein
MLLDTNVILDVLLQRQPWLSEAQQVWQAIDNRLLNGYISANSLTDIFYVTRKMANLKVAYDSIQICLDAFEICIVDRAALTLALSFSGNDFEDNLQISCATLNNIDYIVTRDKAGFALSPIPAITPAEVLQQLNP